MTYGSMHPQAGDMPRAKAINATAAAIYLEGSPAGTDFSIVGDTTKGAFLEYLEGLAAAVDELIVMCRERQDGDGR